MTSTLNRELPTGSNLAYQSISLPDCKVLVLKQIPVHTGIEPWQPRYVSLVPSVLYMHTLNCAFFASIPEQTHAQFSAPGTWSNMDMQYVAAAKLPAFDV